MNVSVPHPDDRQPTVLITGLAGAGKTTLAEWMREDRGFLHLDGDVRGADGIDLCGLRDQWDRFHRHDDPFPLARTLRERTRLAGAAGALLSLPSTLLFTIERIAAARDAGLETVLLFGEPDRCLQAFLDRERRAGTRLDEPYWHRTNDRAYRRYGDAAFETVRFPAFTPDGARWTRAALVERFAAWLACRCRP